MAEVEVDNMDFGDLYLPVKPTNLPKVITGSVLAWPVLSPNDTPVGVILPPALRPHTQEASRNLLLPSTPHPVPGKS